MKKKVPSCKPEEILTKEYRSQEIHYETSKRNEACLRGELVNGRASRAVWAHGGAVAVDGSREKGMIRPISILEQKNGSSRSEPLLSRSKWELSYF